jgi:hypothetical protein
MIANSLRKAKTNFGETCPALSTLSSSRSMREVIAGWQVVGMFDRIIHHEAGAIIACALP